MSLIDRVDDVPVPGRIEFTLDLYRRRTDNFCTILAVVLSLGIFIYSCVVLNSSTYDVIKDHALKVIFPNDSEGNVCGYDFPGYPYVYFSDLQDMVLRFI